MKHLLAFVSMALVSSLVAAQPAKGSPADFQAALWGSSCAACHGTDGRAEGVGMSIGGRPAAELAGMLLAYKSGDRIGTIMHQHAKGYSDDELKRIAQYFSELK